jgi:NitT/TauT family transport system ATP-binding protein
LGPAGQRPAAAITNVGLTYGSGDQARVILRDISFDIAEKRFVCIIGPSGCGKTTLLRMLAGLVMPSVGQVAFFGEPVSGPSRERAIVFQDYGKALLPWRSVWSNVALAFESRGLPRAEQRDRPMRCAGCASIRSASSIRASCRAACSSACRSPAASRRSRGSC